MSRILAGIVVGALGLYAYQRAHRPDHHEAAADDYAAMESEPVERPTPAVDAGESRFHCDGRTYCSQMTSCEEATYFLQHCPGVKMDGEGDGIPCERQWCGSH